ncbi:uncharacterized protein BT62DRAFT_391312 [Guyanagaster necrorhizus]|uniref:Uncharacterized protein n=1 Tax=Guyanagaster necrorhizus TaxID=856835 RepID=A0A9P7W2J9_9AGAR|nr:uncharacterized protein BT62DRAFT_391312 [Guyanagaster necrorhizus MCA 3950]KAG7451017.1 hypothetical protein BT62DRAFT_391312 [Guyanagaster necrorhizus MCA 3950]
MPDLSFYPNGRHLRETRERRNRQKIPLKETLGPTREIKEKEEGQQRLRGRERRGDHLPLGPPNLVTYIGDIVQSQYHGSFFFWVEAIAEAVRRHSRFQHAALGSLGFKPSRHVSVRLEDSER